MRPIHNAIILTAAGLASFVWSTSAELIYTENFNTDGSGSRYTIDGHFVSEVTNHAANGIQADQLGPVYWARNTEVSIVGVPGSTPARRAMMAWTGNLFDTNELSTEFLKLFDSTVKWLMKGKTNGIVLFQPDAYYQGGLDEYFRLAGYTVTNDDNSIPADSVVADLIIKCPNNPGQETRFSRTPIPLLTWDAIDHDDMLLGLGGSVASFTPGDATIVSPSHPAAGGLSGSFPVVNFPANYSWQLLGSRWAEGATTIASLSYTPDGSSQPVSVPLLVVMNGPEEGGVIFGGGPFVGYEGSGFFGGAALNKYQPAPAPNRSVTLNPVNVAGKPDLKLTMACAATFFDFEFGQDYLDVRVGEQGADLTNYIQLVHFTAPTATDKFFDDRSTLPSNPTQLRLSFQDVTYNIPSGYNNLVVRVEAFTSWFNEIVAFDNIRIYSGSIAPPQFETPTIVNGKVRLVWTGGGTLQSTSDFKTWADIAGATSPHEATIIPGGKVFYRVKQ